mgnify:CR=1 FL=1
MFFWLLGLAVHLLVCCGANNNEKEGDILLRFRSALSQASSDATSSKLESWRANSDPCVDSWVGIKCASVDTQGQESVSEIELVDMELAGNINALSELRSLQNLKHLALYNNLLSGSIPDSILSLTRLELLRLDRNRITGAVPSGILNPSKMPLLSYLDLAENAIEGHIPGENHGNNPLGAHLGSQLEQLYLFKNMLTGAIPANLWQLSALKELRLDQNMLSGGLSIPTSTGSDPDSNKGKLAFLQYLDVSRNAFSGPLEQVLGLGEGKERKEGEKEGEGGIISSVPAMPALQELFMYHNLFSGPISPSFCDLKHLSGIRLDSNRLTGAVPACLHEMENLRVLGLGNNPFLENVYALPSEMDNEYSRNFTMNGRTCRRSLLAFNGTEGEEEEDIEEEDMSVSTKNEGLVFRVNGTRKSF